MKKSDLKTLRGIGHHLNPVITVGASGLSDTLIAELDRALTDHELIKVKIPAGDLKSRQDCGRQLAEAVGADVVHHIGRVVLLYKQNPNPNEKLSNIARFG